MDMRQVWGEHKHVRCFDREPEGKRTLEKPGNMRGENTKTDHKKQDGMAWAGLV